MKLFEICKYRPYHPCLKLGKGKYIFLMKRYDMDAKYYYLEEVEEILQLRYY